MAKSKKRVIKEKISEGKRFWILDNEIENPVYFALMIYLLHYKKLKSHIIENINQYGLNERELKEISKEKNKGRLKDKSIYQEDGAVFKTLEDLKETKKYLNWKEKKENESKLEFRGLGDLKRDDINQYIKTLEKHNFVFFDRENKVELDFKRILKEKKPIFNSIYLPFIQICSPESSFEVIKRIIRMNEHNKLDYISFLMYLEQIFGEIYDFFNYNEVTKEKNGMNITPKNKRDNRRKETEIHKELGWNKSILWIAKDTIAMYDKIHPFEKSGELFKLTQLKKVLSIINDNIRFLTFCERGVAPRNNNINDLYFSQDKK